MDFKDSHEEATWRAEYRAVIHSATWRASAAGSGSTSMRPITCPIAASPSNLE